MRLSRSRLLAQCLTMSSTPSLNSVVNPNTVASPNTMARLRRCNLTKLLTILAISVYLCTERLTFTGCNGRFTNLMGLGKQRWLVKGGDNGR